MIKERIPIQESMVLYGSLPHQTKHKAQRTIIDPHRSKHTVKKLQEPRMNQRRSAEEEDHHNDQTVLESPFPTIQIGETNVTRWNERTTNTHTASDHSMQQTEIILQHTDRIEHVRILCSTSLASHPRHKRE